MYNTKVRFIFYDSDYTVISNHVVEFEGFLFPVLTVLYYAEKLQQEFPEIYTFDFEWMKL